MLQPCWRAMKASTCAKDYQKYLQLPHNSAADRHSSSGATFLAEGPDSSWLPSPAGSPARAALHGAVLNPESWRLLEDGGFMGHVSLFVTVYSYSAAPAQQLRPKTWAELIKLSRRACLGRLGPSSCSLASRRICRKSLEGRIACREGSGQSSGGAVLVPATRSASTQRSQPCVHSRFPVTARQRAQHATCHDGLQLLLLTAVWHRKKQSSERRCNESNMSMGYVKASAAACHRQDPTGSCCLAAGTTSRWWFWRSPLPRETQLVPP